MEGLLPQDLQAPPGQPAILFRNIAYHDPLPSCNYTKQTQIGELEFRNLYYTGSVRRVREAMARGGQDVELREHAAVVGGRRRLQEQHQRPQSAPSRQTQNYHSST